MGEDGATGLWLVVREGGGPRKLRIRGSGCLRVGRAPDSDVVLETARVSRRHAEIRFRDGEVRVLDLGSGNGTFVNGASVQEVPLEPGDVVTVGGAELELQLDPGVPSVVTHRDVTHRDVTHRDVTHRDVTDRDVTDRDVTHRDVTRPDVARRDVTPQHGGSQDGAPREDRATEPATGDGAVAATTSKESPRSSALYRKGPRQRSRPPPRPAALLLVGLPVIALGTLLGLAALESPAWLPEGARTLVEEWTRPSPGTVRRVGRARRVDRARRSSSVPGPSRGEEPVAIRSAAVPSVGGEATTVSLVGGRLEEALSRVRPQELGFEQIEVLERLVEAHPVGAELFDLGTRLELLQATRRGDEAQRQAEAEERLTALSEEERYGTGVAVASFLERTARTPLAEDHWRQRAEAIEVKAAKGFEEVTHAVTALLEAGKDERALAVLLDARRSFAGTRVDDEKLPGLADAIARRGRPTRQSDPAISRLREAAAVAFEECRFDDLRVAYLSLLAFDLPIEDRARSAEDLFEAVYLEQMLAELVAAAEVGPVAVKLHEGYSSRLLRADAKGIEYEIEIQGKAVARKTERWSRLSPLRKLDLFRSVSHKPGGVLGLAIFAFRIGYDEGAHRALIRLRRADGMQSLVDAVLSRRLGIAVPAEGFVEHQGRLLTQEAKAAVLARARAARKEELAVRARLKAAKRDTRLESLVAQAQTFRGDGLFALAQAILSQISERFPKTPAGGEARRLVRDPLLARHTLHEGGPSSRRLDLCILGEGYPVLDEEQAAFLALAQRARKVLFTTEPYREYEAYFNVHALQLGSRDRGVDREPGGAQRDTALGGKIEWDVFTVERQRVYEILDALGEAGEDRQAIVIGNDLAGTATGGGGVSSVSKASLGAIPHEVGHALGGLHDEYDFRAGNNPAEQKVAGRGASVVPLAPAPPNLMRGSVRDEVEREVIWRHWIDAGSERWWNGSKVGLFEGGGYTPFNVWRPQAGCKMRTADAAFCVVCMEVMVKSIYRHVRPIDRVEPTDDRVVLRRGESILLKVWPLQPATHSLETRWFFSESSGKDATDEGGIARTVSTRRVAEKSLRRVSRRTLPDGRVVDFAELRWKDFVPGRYSVRAQVEDTTEWVLEDPEGLLLESRRWSLEVLPRRASPGADSGAGRRGR